MIPFPDSSVLCLPFLALVDSSLALDFVLKLLLFSMLSLVEFILSFSFSSYSFVDDSPKYKSSAVLSPLWLSLCFQVPHQLASTLRWPTFHHKFKVFNGGSIILPALVSFLFSVIPSRLVKAPVFLTHRNTNWVVIADISLSSTSYTQSVINVPQKNMP